MTNPSPCLLKKKRYFFQVTCGLILISLVLVSGLSDVREIDRHSGKVRQSQQLYGLVLKSHVKETVFSKMASPFVTETEPDWKKESVFPFWGGISPHYRYHGAIAHTSCVAIIIEHKNLSGDDKNNLLQAALEYLNTGNKEELLSMISHFYEKDENINISNDWSNKQ